MTERRRYFLKYVQEVQPQIMEQFADKAHPQVVDAMRQTVTNMLGTLPPQFFQVTISTVGENLAQLMYTVLMSGYMFRNAQYRMDMRNSMGSLMPGGFSDQVAGQLAAAPATDEQYAPGSQKNGVMGEVVRWSHQDGAEVLPADKYIEMLEREVRLLKEQVSTRQRLDEDRNDLIEYLKSLEPHNLQELTENAGEDVLDAMNSFIQRLLGSNDPEELKSASNESTAAELARMLYWLMVVGYSLRTIEVRFDMERTLDSPDAADLPSELPGQNGL